MVSLIDLPHQDIICQNIFCYMTLEDLAQLQYTNKTLQSLVLLYLDKYYKVIHFNNDKKITKMFSNYPIIFQKIITNKKNIKSVSFKIGSFLTDEMIIPFIMNSEKLNYLSSYIPDNIYVIFTLDLC